MEQAILQFFESIRSAALTPVAALFGFLGEGLVVGAAVILLYWLIGGRRGEELLFTVLTSASVNAMMKEGVRRPRPYAAGVVERLDLDTPLFSTRDLGDYISFPSGHAQSSLAFTSSCALTAKKRRGLVWTAALLLPLLIALSRLYFGVHYPSDLLAGMGFGLLIALFWHAVFRELYAFRYYFLGYFALVALFALPFAPTSDMVHTSALIAGAAFFSPLASFLKYSPPKSFKRRLLRLPVGLLSVGAVYACTLLFPEGAAFSLLRWFLLAGAAIFLAELLFRILKI